MTQPPIDPSSAAGSAVARLIDFSCHWLVGWLTDREDRRKAMQDEFQQDVAAINSTSPK